MENEILINQLKKQAKIFHDDGETDACDNILEMINHINSLIKKHDTANVKIELKATLRKYDGEIEDGKEPVETITF